MSAAFLSLAKWSTAAVSHKRDRDEDCCLLCVCVCGGGGGGPCHLWVVMLCNMPFFAGWLCLSF